MRKIALLGALVLAGCAPTSQLHLSAGRLGCSTSEIIVGDVDSTSHSETWSATCRGQTYFCSATDEFREVVCKPQLKPAPVAAPAAVPVAPARAPEPYAEPTL